MTDTEHTPDVDAAHPPVCDSDDSPCCLGDMPDPPTVPWSLPGDDPVARQFSGLESAVTVIYQQAPNLHSGERLDLMMALMKGAGPDERERLIAWLLDVWAPLPEAPSVAEDNPFSKMFDTLDKLKTASEQWKARQAAKE